MSDNMNCVAIERRDGDPLALVLRGDVNIYVAALLHELTEILLQEHGDIAVSCEQLTHLDTSALQIILALHQDLQTQGRSLRLTGVSADTKIQFHLAGVNIGLLQGTTPSK